MPKHTTKPILPSDGLLARTPYQFSRYIVTGFTGASRNCAFVQNKCTTNRGIAQWEAIHNGCRSRADAVICAVPPFIRTPKDGGFLEVSL